MTEMLEKIALEEHFLLDKPEHVERFLASVPILPPEAVRAIRPLLHDLGDGRLETMDKAGIRLAVLSSAAIVQGVADRDAALRVAREANDALAEAVRAHPDRYAGFASIPLQDPQAGADELERAVTELGMVGAMVFGHTDGHYLDEDRYSVMWERLESLDVPLYLHASDAATPISSYAGRPELLGPTWSWTAETAAHTLRIVLGGVFERFPDARLILGHMGETLPYILWRVDQHANAFSTEKPADPPSTFFRRNVLVTTAGVFSDEPVICALDALGEDRVMFSVDHPFENSDVAAAWLEATPVSPEVKEKVARSNASDALGLRKIAVGAAD
jgi:2,3-dihydroxybenzoate decarboxylase